MNSSQTNRYHHGDLKQALMVKALIAINEVGIEALTLRKLSQQLEVSHTACYRHFKNKDTLLAALVQQGFEIFLQALQSAYCGKQHVLDQLHALGSAYLNFAEDHRAHYQLMFNGALLLKIDEEQSRALALARTQAFDYFVACLVDAQEKKFVCGGNPQQLAFFMWSSLHGACGLSALFEHIETDRDVPQPSSQQDILEHVLQKIYSGIGP